MSNNPPQAPQDDAEAEYERFVWSNLRRNYIGHFLHGMLGMTGFRVLTAPTLIPAYLFLLSGSNLIVGLGMSLQQAGQIVSPVIGANLVEHRKRVLPAAMVLGTAMRLPILGMALAAWMLDGPPLVWTFILMLTLMGVFQGAQRVVFQLLLAKVIPITRRGRLQAMRNITGGAIAAGLSWVAGHYFIEADLFGDGYAVTFLVVFLLTSAGLAALRALMIEPEPPTIRPKTRLSHRLRDLRVLVGEDGDYRNFLIAQLLAVAGRMAAPFYILHAGAAVGISGATIGLFTFAFLGADTASNLVWGYLGDRAGFRSNFIGALVIWIASLALLIFADSTPLFILAFAGLGAAQAGYLMASQTLVLEFGHRDDTAMRLGVSATAEGIMLAAGPLLGGFIVLAAGYPGVFTVALVLQAVSLAVCALGVKEPRGRAKS